MSGVAVQVIEFKHTVNLDDLISKRCSVLTKYQNAAYASQYRDFVDRVRAAEMRLADASKPLRLTAAVANYLFKLMAYKDEYEVARLYTDRSFAAKIGQMFEGDYQIKFHLAPPLLSKKDAHGHLIKQEFGGWMMRVFSVLAKCKGLRGTALDIFGHSAERKMERGLIVAYRHTITTLLTKLTPENLSIAVAIASIPEEIRGYGHVKDHHLTAAIAKEAALLAQFNTPGAPTVPAHPADRHAA